MLSFFKINDPYRLVAVFLIALLIKLPFLINPVFSYEQAYWLTIGEALGNGTMYLDVWDSMAPLAASLYYWVVLIFGKSMLTLNILGFLLNFVIAILLNQMFIRNKVYEQNTYVPAFVYIVLSNLHVSFSLFSPMQIGLIFVLLALGNLLGHIEFRAKRDEQIMNIGLYLGVASLFYFPLVVFVPIMLVLFIMFTSTQNRRYLLFLVGSMLPLAFAFCYYWVATEKAGYFVQHFIWPYFYFDRAEGQWWDMVKIALPLILLMLVGTFSTQLQRRLNNFQVRLNQLFIVIMILTPLIYLLVPEFVPSTLQIFLPIISFFVVHLLLLFRRGLVGEIITLVFAFLIIFSLFDEAKDITGWFNKKETISLIQSVDELRYVKDRRMMVLGDNRELYYSGSLATPFFDWRLSEPFFQSLDYYDNLVFLQESINQQQPEIIIDYEHLWGPIASRLPLVAVKYRQVTPTVWVLR